MKDLINKLFKDNYILRIDEEFRDFTFGKFYDFKDLNDAFKQIYGPLIKDMIPNKLSLWNKLPKSLNTNMYHQPVILSKIHGITEEE